MSKLLWHLFGQLLETFGQHFYSIIWSHWPPQGQTQIRERNNSVVLTFKNTSNKSKKELKRGFKLMISVCLWPFRYVYIFSIYKKLGLIWHFYAIGQICIAVGEWPKIAEII